MPTDARRERETMSKEHTPKGYRIEGEKKFLLLPHGDELKALATECEMELWEQNRVLREALEEAAEGLHCLERGSCYGDPRVGQTCSNCRTRIKIRAALRAGEVTGE